MQNTTKKKNVFTWSYFVGEINRKMCVNLSHMKELFGLK